VSTAAPEPAAATVERCDAPAGAALLQAVPHPRPFACRIDTRALPGGGTVNHVSNVEYVRWLDRIAELHGDSAGFTRSRLMDAGVMWFVARHEIDYLGEVTPGDELMALTWVRDAARVKAWRDTLIVRTPDHAPVLRAATLWVFVNLSTRRPTRIDPAMLDGLDARRP
jgi:acyl-CoA thioester hydrolase